MAIRKLRPEQEMVGAFLMCRRSILGHAWDVFNPIDVTAPAWGTRLSIRCVRCGTERHDVIDSKGAIGQRRYIYPDGYAMAERLEATTLRHEFVQRIEHFGSETHLVMRSLKGRKSA